VGRGSGIPTGQFCLAIYIPFQSQLVGNQVDIVWLSHSQTKSQARGPVKKHTKIYYKTFGYMEIYGYLC